MAWSLEIHHVDVKKAGDATLRFPARLLKTTTPSSGLGSSAVWAARLMGHSKSADWVKIISASTTG
jgi:hypothetical protein